MRLLVTGASGLLGLNLSLVATTKGYAVTGLVNSQSLQGVPFDIRQANLLDLEVSLSVIETSKPEAIIHCAAVANLNEAEKAPEKARFLNGVVPGTLAAAASCWGVPFVHISTDAVFDGQQVGYVETDSTNPLSVYASTKLAGERAVQDANPDAIIARVVFFGWSLSGNRSLSEFFFNNLRDGNPLQGFVNTSFCPLYVEDLADTLLEMSSAGLSGLYHVVSPENMSKYDFGVRIANKFAFEAGLIEPIEAGAVEGWAPRSNNLVLNPEKVQTALGHSLPSVDAGIERFYQRWQEGYPKQLHSYSG